jgi:diguanylate cyclase (GGDEF)-like protein
VVLLPGADIDKTVEIAERLRDCIEREPEGKLTVTVSFGAAAACGEFDVRDLYERADAALLEAKRAGRNRVVSAQPLANSLSDHAAGVV